MHHISRKARLLSLALTFSVYVSWQTAAGAKNSSPPIDRFESEIVQFEKADRLAPPPVHGTEFVGSSSIKRWKSLDEDFKSFQAYNRGFGGSTITEISHYFNRVVAKYQPESIVLYAGTNDIAEGHSAQQIEADFETFARQVETALPKTKLYFISMSVAPRRESLSKVFDEGNRLIQVYIQTTSWIHYVDVNPVMRDSDNHLKPYFIEDQLHMNRAGYEAWIPVIKSALAH